MKLERILLRGDFDIVNLFCKSADVERLEASHAELLQTLYKCGQLLEILHVEDVEINKLINEHYHLVRDVVVKFGGEDLNSMD